MNIKISRCATGWGADALACVLIVLAVAAIPSALRLEVDNRLERWVEPQGLEARQYRDFRANFGSDEFVLAAYSGKPIFDEDGMMAQLDTLERLERVQGVRTVSGMPAVYRDRFGAEDLDAFHEDALATPFYKNFLISNDGNAAGLLIETTPVAQSTGRQQLVRDIRQALQPLQDFGYRVHAVGPPLLNAELDETSRKEGQRVFPMAVLLSSIALWGLFRSARAALVAMGCAALSVLLAIGVMVWTNHTLNMVSSAFPPLLWVISLTNSIHILRRYQVQQMQLGDRSEAIRRARAETAMPCSLAAFTTAAGFFSLVTANMAPVRELGFLAAAGIALSLPVNLTVGPLLIGLLRVPGIRTRKTLSACHFGALVPWYERWKRVILMLAVVLVLLSASAIPWVRAESDPLSFLPKDSPILEDHAAVAQSLAGFYTLELVITLGDSWMEPSDWAPLEKLSDTLASQPGVARVLSPLDILKKLNQWDHQFDPAYYALPKSAQEAQDLTGNLDGKARAELDRMVSKDGGKVRLSALVNVMDSTRFMSIVDAAQRALDALPAPLSGYRTGIVLQLVQSQLSLVDTQIRSLGFAFATIFLCIFAGLRSWRLTVASMLPNVLPILAVLAAMASLGIALDAATVMVAGVALGIAVDDTIHVLSEFQRARREGALPQQAVADAMSHAGSAMIIATLTSCIGFFSLVGSQFVPIAWFGLLSGIALLSALCVELLVTPALLLSIERQPQSNRHGL